MKHRLGPTRLSVRFAITTILGLVVAGIIFEVVHIAAAPSNGHLISVRASDKSIKPSVTPIPESEPSTNRYYALNLPPGFNVTSTLVGDGTIQPLLTQTIIRSGSEGSLIIAVAVYPLIGGSLNNNSSYRMRVTKSAQYLESTPIIANQNIEIFKDTKSSQITAFMMHGGFMASISVSTDIANPFGDEDSGQASALQAILSGWSWL